MAQPLTDDHLAAIKVGLGAAKEAKDLLQRAEAAGMDVSAQKETIQKGEERLLGLKRAFFPNQ